MNPQIRDTPWTMRTYGGHSDARSSNALYRRAIAKGQTGLSIAFDLPTQLGYDPDHPQALHEVGRVGVPVSHIGHLSQLYEGIDIQAVSTSMTINATAPWLLALYIANAERQSIAIKRLRGTTQNDLCKEFLSRGTQIIPASASRALAVDLVSYCADALPLWNPISISSYHLSEAGATPVQEIAYSLANAADVLDAIKSLRTVDDAQFSQIVSSMSFFVSAGIRFVEECCKLRAFARLWDRLLRERFHVNNERARRFRYGVQVASVGLTANQPENNVQRIVLELLGATLSRSARARSVQLPAWNEALGIPRDVDQQWSLRIQQVLALETDLLEYDDIFEGSRIIESKTEDLGEQAWLELNDILGRGGAFNAIEEMKYRILSAQVTRMNQLERGDLPLIGLNTLVETDGSPLMTSGVYPRAVPSTEKSTADEIIVWRTSRDSSLVNMLLRRLRRCLARGQSIMQLSLELARAGGTTGEWGAALRDVFGEDTGPSAAATHRILRLKSGDARTSTSCAPRLLLAKVGLDGHTNGIEQVAIAAANGGYEVFYVGVRKTNAQLVNLAIKHRVDLIGISVHSGNHRDIVPDLLARMREGAVDAPLVIGGAIPREDRQHLCDLGVAAVFTSTDYRPSRVVEELKAALSSVGGHNSSVLGSGPRTPHHE